MRRLGRWLARRELHDLRVRFEVASDRNDFLRGVLDRVERERGAVLDRYPGGLSATEWMRRALRAEEGCHRLDNLLAQYRDADPEHRAVVGSGPVWGGP